MSQQGKVSILNSRGGIMTSAKQAVRLMASGQARYVDENTIEILATAASADSDAERSPQARHSPTPGRVVEFKRDAFTGQTFLHYPQPGSFRKAA